MVDNIKETVFQTCASSYQLKQYVQGIYELKPDNNFNMEIPGGHKVHPIVEELLAIYRWYYKKSQLTLRMWL